MRKMVTVKDGEWIQPTARRHLMACCDCGLIHKMDFRIRKGRVQFRAYRAKKATRKWRRKRSSAL